MQFGATFGGDHGYLHTTPLLCALLDPRYAGLRNIDSSVQYSLKQNLTAEMSTLLFSLLFPPHVSGLIVNEQRVDGDGLDDEEPSTEDQDLLMTATLADPLDVECMPPHCHSLLFTLPFPPHPAFLLSLGIL